MALRRTIVKTLYGQNLTISNSYSKVTYLSGNKEKLNFTVSVYDENITEVIEEKPYMFIPSITEDSPNFIKQSYEYLKTLEEYIGAEDC